MSPSDAPDLPSRSWTEGQKLSTKGGGELQRWGNVTKARQVLDGCDRQVIYDLIDVGAIVAYKLKPHRPNSPWKIDLLSVWKHKQKQLPSR